MKSRRQDRWAKRPTKSSGLQTQPTWSAGRNEGFAVHRRIRMSKELGNAEGACWSYAGCWTGGSAIQRAAWDGRHDGCRPPRLLRLDRTECCLTIRFETLFPG